MTEATALEIIDEMYEGITPVKSIVKSKGYQTKPFYQIINSNPSLSDAFSRAQVTRAEFMADEVVEIADNEENPNKARNMIEARKWATSKLNPSKFADRIDLNVNQTVSIVDALSAAKNRIRDVTSSNHLALDNSTTGLEPAHLDEPALNELSDLLS